MTAPDGRFGGRAVLVSGAGMGIGEAVAALLASEGAAVGAFDRDADAVNETVAGIEAGGGRALAIVGDVRSEADAKAAVERTVEAFDRLDGLANLAGVLGPAEADCDVDTWDMVLDTNLKGTFLLSKQAMPQLRRRGGAIVNAASVLAFASVPLHPAYCASKGGVVALTSAMALDHAREGVRVNCIAPGSVRTPMLHGSYGELDEAELEAALAHSAEQHPAGRLVEPREVAQLVAFLLSDYASAITGGCHRVDNGLLARLAL